MMLRLEHNHRNIQAVLFDMDGVLVDSIPLHIRSWNQVLSDCHLPVFEEKLYFSTLGHTNLDMLESYCIAKQITLSERQINDILIKKEAAFRENIRMEAKATPGVMDWLRYFKQQGILCGVASSGTMANITCILSRLQMADFFAVILSGMNFPLSKPDPFIFNAAAAALGVPAPACLVIEDAPAGIEAAQRAGMLCCAIATSYPKCLLDGADLVLDSLAEDSPQNLFIIEEEKR
jgi:beta-phosphoglucomutase